MPTQIVPIVPAPTCYTFYEYMLYGFWNSLFVDFFSVRLTDKENDKNKFDNSFSYTPNDCEMYFPTCLFCLFLNLLRVGY